MLNIAITKTFVLKTLHNNLRRGYPPPNLSFLPRFISTCNNISATSLLWPQNPPKATSKGLDFKNSLGEHPHTTQQTPTPSEFLCCGAAIYLTKFKVYVEK